MIARDRHASFVCALALLGGVLERIATTVRLLQMTEVDQMVPVYTSVAEAVPQ